MSYKRSVSSDDKQRGACGVSLLKSAHSFKCGPPRLCFLRALALRFQSHHQPRARALISHLTWRHQVFQGALTSGLAQFDAEEPEVICPILVLD